MKRKAIFLEMSSITGISIYVDEFSLDIILEYIERDERHRKKFEYIKRVIIENLRIPDVFDKENISEKCKDVFAMKFFKGQENDRIYCKKMFHNNRRCIVFIMAELHEKKKSQKNSKKEIVLIEKVSSYEYEFDR